MGLFRTDKMAEKSFWLCRKKFVSLHRLSGWRCGLDNRTEGLEGWTHASGKAGSPRVQGPRFFL